MFGASKKMNDFNPADLRGGVLRVIVCGGRNFHNIEFIWRKLDEILEAYSIIELAEGEANGVDLISRSWAEARKISVRKFPAEWEKYGVSAGPIRNKEMFDKFKPDCVIAFCYGSGNGTKGMIDIAKKNDCRIIEIHGSV